MGAPASQEEKEFVTHRERDKHGAPVPAYNNGMVAGKVREVEWKEPDAAPLATLKPVQGAFPG